MEFWIGGIILDFSCIFEHSMLLSERILVRRMMLVFKVFDYHEGKISNTSTLIDDERHYLGKNAFCLYMVRYIDLLLLIVIVTIFDDVGNVFSRIHFAQHVCNRKHFLDEGPSGNKHPGVILFAFVQDVSHIKARFIMSEFEGIRFSCILIEKMRMFYHIHILV